MFGNIARVPTPGLRENRPVRTPFHRAGTAHPEFPRHLSQLLTQELADGDGLHRRRNQPFNRTHNASGVVGLNQVANLRPRNPFGGHGNSLSRFTERRDESVRFTKPGGLVRNESA